jgi:hypothetical protein
MPARGMRSVKKLFAVCDMMGFPGGGAGEISAARRDTPHPSQRAKALNGLVWVS